MVQGGFHNEGVGRGAGMRSDKLCQCSASTLQCPGYGGVRWTDGPQWRPPFPDLVHRMLGAILG